MTADIPVRWIVEKKMEEDEICRTILKENIASYNAEIKELNHYCKEHKDDRFARIRLGSLKRTRREMKTDLKALTG